MSTIVWCSCWLRFLEAKLLRSEGVLVMCGKLIGFFCISRHQRSLLLVIGGHLDIGIFFCLVAFQRLLSGSPRLAVTRYASRNLFNRISFSNCSFVQYCVYFRSIINVCLRANGDVGVYISVYFSPNCSIVETPDIGPL